MQLCQADIAVEDFWPESLAATVAKTVSTTPVDISKFKTKWFWLRPKDPFYVVDTGLHGGNFSTGDEVYTIEKDKNLKGLKLLALGFVDNDKMNDLITTTDKSDELTVHYFSADTYRFETHESF